ncbi:DUF4282 domain-containing protein, partial [Kribbia dieselivorans]|uniref:DUF4282 domain-containing protein n=1 Tax=Kribbia dieselivorans TaxID=331526 RepID=UPI0008385D31
QPQQPQPQPQAQQAQPQQYAQQPYPTDPLGQPHGAPTAAAPKAPRGGLAALFDFSFTTYATPQIVRIVFLIVTTLLVLAGLGSIGSAFMTDPIVGIVALLLVPLVVIFYLAMIRMSLELVSAVIRISEDVHERLPDARR